MSMVVVAMLKSKGISWARTWRFGWGWEVGEVGGEESGFDIQSVMSMSTSRWSSSVTAETMADGGGGRLCGEMISGGGMLVVW